MFLFLRLFARIVAVAIVAKAIRVVLRATVILGKKHMRDRAGTAAHHHAAIATLSHPNGTVRAFGYGHTTAAGGREPTTCTFQVEFIADPVVEQDPPAPAPQAVDTVTDDTKAKEPPRDAEGLRLDGPTPAEYAAAGYSGTYPPEGYAPRSNHFDQADEATWPAIWPDPAAVEGQIEAKATSGDAEGQQHQDGEGEQS
jgi:hypothetical protein